MREWNTPERVCDTLRQCEQNGINAFQYAHHERGSSECCVLTVALGRRRSSERCSVSYRCLPRKSTLKVVLP
jgi:hypothetical protein